MNAVSAETMVLASEVANYVKRIKDGIGVDMSCEGFDLIKEVGPRGDFISTDHTLTHFRKELWGRTIFDCSAVKGEKRHLETNVIKNAIEKKKKVMSKYKPIEVPAGGQRRPLKRSSGDSGGSFFNIYKGRDKKERSDA